MTRPNDLGEAYFWITSKIVDISPSRNHRDWLLTNSQSLNLPDYIHTKKSKALWESYKKGVIRIVWDKNGQWKTVNGKNTLYLSGFKRDIWTNIKSIVSYHLWMGNISTIVFDYVQDVNGNPRWYGSDIFSGWSLESIYRGKFPRREILPIDAIY